MNIICLGELKILDSEFLTKSMILLPNTVKQMQP